MKKIIVLIIIFSLLSIMLSGCIEDDGNENENLKINRNTKFSLKSVNNNNFINEPLFLNLSIENIGNVDMKLNEFNIKNIFFILDISPVYNCGEDSYTISSKNDNKINGHTWDTNNKSILEKNNDLYIKINLNEVIFYYPQSSRNNSYVWNTFEKFLEDSYWISWINVYCNIKAYFIPEKDISNTIVSNNENITIKWKPRYEKNIQRNTHSYEEKQALKNAESINYTSLLKIERFEYDWANYIDNITIEYYCSNIDQSEKEKRQAYIFLNYTANVNSYNKIIIENQSGVISIYDNNEELHKLKHLDWKKHKTLGLINGTLQEIEGDFQLEYNNIIICEMNLGFHDTRGSLAAVIVYASQIIIFDGNLNLIFMIIFPSNHIVS